MIELLRDPAWNGIAGLAAIVALIVAIWQEKKIAKGLPNFFVTVGRSLIGILVLFWGPLVQGVMEQLFAGGIPQITTWWNNITGFYGINTLALAYFLYAAFPGIVAAFIASTKVKRAFIRTAIACAITLTITDSIIIFINSNRWVVGILEIRSFFASLLYNIIGGTLAGIIIAFFVNLYNKAFDFKE